MNQRNPSVLETQLVKNVLAARDSPCINPLSFITPEGQLSEKGILPTPKLEETDGFQCLGHSNWTICNPLSLFCSETFTSFHLHTGEPILITPAKRAVFGKGKFSQLPLLALWGNKNGLPSMKWKKLKIFRNKIGLKGCKWSRLNAPGTETPQSYPYWELEEFPFLIIGLLG